MKPDERGCERERVFVPRWRVLAVCLAFCGISDSPAAAGGKAVLRFDEPACSCSASYDPKLYTEAQLRASLAVALETFDSEIPDSNFFLTYDGINDRYKVTAGEPKVLGTAELPTLLTTVRAAKARVHEKRLAALRGLQIVPEFEPLRTIQEAAVRARFLAEDATLNYLATRDAKLLAAPLDGAPLAPRCQAYAAFAGMADRQALLQAWTAQENKVCESLGKKDRDTCLYNVRNSLRNWNERKSERVDMIKFDWHNCVLDHLYARAGYDTFTAQRDKALAKVLRNKRCRCDGE